MIGLEYITYLVTVDIEYFVSKKLTNELKIAILLFYAVWYFSSSQVFPETHDFSVDYVFHLSCLNGH